MSSLVSSIFGGGVDEKPESSATLFGNKEQFQDIPLKEDYHVKESRRGKKKPKGEGKEGLSGEELAEKERCTVFVGNLPVDTTRKSLTKLFSDCGTISSARIRSAPVTPVKVSQKGDPNLVRRVASQMGKLDSSNKASVHGYVVFEKEESVVEALKQNNMLLPGGGSRRIRVDCAQPTWMENTQRAVFVGNLPFDDPNAESDLQKHFARHCGCTEDEIEGVRIIRDKTTYLGKGFGYVLLATSQLQGTALRFMPNTSYKNRTLRVIPCTKAKRKKPPKENEESNAAKRYNTNTAPKRKADGNTQTDAVGALKRLLTKEHESGTTSKKKRRARGTTSKPTAHKAGGSKKTKDSDKKYRKLIQNRVDQVKNERRGR